MSAVTTRKWAAFIAVAAALALSTGFAERAEAKVPIYDFATSVTDSQAGGHPDLVIDFTVGTYATEPVTPCLCLALKDVEVNTPAGLLGVPGNTPRCTIAELTIAKCPVDSQLGITALDTEGPAGNTSAMALYNMVPRPDQVALVGFGIPIFRTPVYTGFTARTESDFGLEALSYGVPTFFPPSRVTLFIWGVPANQIHDTLRVPYYNWGVPQKFFEVLSRGVNGCSNNDPRPALERYEYPTEECPEIIGSPPEPSNSPETPFITNPTACVGVRESTIRTDSYDLEKDHSATTFAPTTGCDQLSFDPTLSAKPTTTEADSPSGVDVVLTVPQTLNPTTPTPSAIKGVKVTLPPGFAINSNAADGKTACTAVEARFGTRLPAECPEFSKIGTLGVESSAFPAELPGAIYLGEPLLGERYRVFLIFDGFSLHVKLAGTAEPDPATGQVTIAFEELPQFSFQRFNMHVYGAERGLLVTPTHCGTYPVETEFVPWASPQIPNQTSTQFFRIDSGPEGSPCPPETRPFEPTFEAGVKDNTGGIHSPLAVNLTRHDGDQLLSALRVVTPPGFTAAVKGVAQCPEDAIHRLAVASGYSGLAEMAYSACPANSLVGSVVAGAGAGTRPLHVSGKVFLAGPYKGAPFSFEVAVPAVSGPYDLGVVTTRVALYVDPLTARVSAVSDPLPQLIEGIPLRVRSIRLDLDRPGFTLNPTNCDPFSVDAHLAGDQGAIADRSTLFQVANCADLPFGPKLSLRFAGGLERRGHPAIHAVLRARPGEANTRAVSVTLPPGELLDNAHIRVICTRVNFAADNCPAGSKIGRAQVTSPILDRPLTGSVYLRSSKNELPDLALDLEGQVEIEAVGRVESVNRRFRTTFEAIPDVPISEIRLDLAGGRKGLLQNTESLCLEAKRASVRMSAQNGVVRTFRLPVQRDCAGNGRRSTKAHGPGRAG
jgi:hypothetical protein